MISGDKDKDTFIIIFLTVMLAVILAVAYKHEKLRSDLIKTGHAQYNPQTGAFELKRCGDETPRH